MNLSGNHEIRKSDVKPWAEAGGLIMKSGKGD
jgi:hypothetical protein